MDDDNGAGDHAQMRCNNRLCEAIHSNALEEVRACISEGVDLKLDNVCQSSKDHECHLARACLLAYEEIIKELLKAGVDPNHVSGRRRQSVMHKTAAGRVLTLSIMRCLISYGADVNIKDGAGKTMLHYLAMGQFNDTDESLFSAVRLLLDNGAICDTADGRGHTPLFDACNSGNVNLAKLFIAEGADVNISHDDGSTILHYLAQGRNNCTDDDLLCVVKLLLDNGAICDARDRLDYTPLKYACYWLKVDLVKLFIAEGADIANADSERSPLLAIACKSCNIDLFDVLLNAGACRTLSHDDLRLPCTKNNHALIARILDTCDVDINMAYKCWPNMTILHCVCYDRDYSTAQK